MRIERNMTAQPLTAAAGAKLNGSDSRRVHERCNNALYHYGSEASKPALRKTILVYTYLDKLSKHALNVDKYCIRKTVQK